MMKFVIAFILIFLIAAHCLSQEKPKVEMIESFEKMTCEDLISRLDRFSNYLSANPKIAGYVVVQTGKEPVKAWFFGRQIRLYKATRNITNERFQIIHSDTRETFAVEFWYGERGNPHNFQQKDINFSFGNIDPKKFSFGNAVEIEKHEGRLYYFDFCPACCIDSLDMTLAAKILENNPTAKVKIRVMGKSKRFFGILKGMLLADLTAKKVSPSRIRIIYAGIDQGIVELGANALSAEVEFITNKK